MCYNKANNELFKDPIASLTISELIKQLSNAKFNLSEIKELPMYKDLFTQGERCSIDELIKKIEYRINLSQGFQKSFM